jgi:hypothetical protein
MARQSRETNVSARLSSIKRIRTEGVGWCRDLPMHVMSFTCVPDTEPLVLTAVDHTLGLTAAQRCSGILLTTTKRPAGTDR